MEYFNIEDWKIFVLDISHLFRNFIIAHLPHLEFLDYRLIDEKMRGEALEAYKELVQVMVFGAT